MKRGTTPTLQITVTGIDVQYLTSIFLTLKQKKVEITKRETDIVKVYDETNNRLDVQLTQKETLSLEDGMVNIQLRAITSQGKAIASNIRTIPVDHILRDGVI